MKNKSKPRNYAVLALMKRAGGSGSHKSKIKPARKELKKELKKILKEF